MRRSIVIFALVAIAIGIAIPGAATALPVDNEPCPLDPETGECLPPPPDADGDGRSDGNDNCPQHYNPGQEDNDHDGIGNLCDTTPDGGGSGGGGGGGGGSDQPEYDPRYAEGESVDESWFEQVCSASWAGYSCLDIVGRKATGCADVGAYVLKKNSFTGIWRFTHTLSFCWSGGRVSAIWNRAINGEILIPGWARTVYPWEWSIISDSPAATGFSSTVSFAKARFKMCAAVRGGPICITDEPWIRLELRGDGTAVCLTSAGRVRNCVFPR